MMRIKVAPDREDRCAACGGTGLAKVKVERPAKPGRRIFPPNCKACGGRGWIKVDGVPR